MNMMIIVIAEGISKVERDCDHLVDICMYYNAKIDVPHVNS